LRAYGQKDPLLEYKSESFLLFQEMMERIRRETITRFFRYELVRTAPPVQGALQGGREAKAETDAYSQARAQGSPGTADPRPPATPVGVGAAAGAPGGATVVREEPKVGRNDPCPCGSGKKYKKCHGRQA
jgi:preprotein translocase subunit SecA